MMRIFVRTLSPVTNTFFLFSNISVLYFIFISRFELFNLNCQRELIFFWISIIIYIIIFFINKILSSSIYQQKNSLQGQRSNIQKFKPKNLLVIDISERLTAQLESIGGRKVDVGQPDVAFSLRLGQLTTDGAKVLLKDEHFIDFGLSFR